MARFLIAFAFLVIIGVPFVARQFTRDIDAAPTAEARENSLIVVTPHIEQIRVEFGRAFAEWHKKKYGQEVMIDWRSPGGTSEILKLLEAQFAERISAGAIRPDGSCEKGTIDFDAMMGGGTFEHSRLRTGVSVASPSGEKDKDGKPVRVSVSMSVPPSPVFSQEELTAIFGENKVGAGQMYQDDRTAAKPNDWQHWIGTALSGFGIVYNRDVLKQLGIAGEPKTFGDLRDFKYYGMIALADPRQSGSVATAYDSVLNEAARAAVAKAKAEGRPDAEGLAAGWEVGWNTLRDLSANARYFSSSSTQPPMDVSQGDAAAALAIDFYGRGQQQAVLAPGQDAATGRVGYVDPAGAVYIDADPVSIIRGGPKPELARRFVEFCMTEQAQALWQFEPRRAAATTGSTEPGTRTSADMELGPQQSRLRRLPIRREMYAKYLDLFTDKVDPFALASAAKPIGWRDAMTVMMGSFGVDAASELRAAWTALNRARANPNFDQATLAEMERLFYSFPSHPMVDGSSKVLNAANHDAIKSDIKRWRDAKRTPKVRIAYTEYFRQTFAKVVALGRTGRTQ